MKIGDLVKHKCSFNKYDGFGIVIDFCGGRAEVEWLDTSSRCVGFHHPHHLEVLCK